MTALDSELKVQQLIGRNIRLLRESRGVSQEELGDMLGITYQQIQKYEKGKSGLSAPRLYAMSQYLYVPYEYFFSGLEESGFSLTPAPDIHPAIMTRALKMQQRCDRAGRDRILKIIDILTG